MEDCLRKMFRLRLQNVAFKVKEIVSKSYEYVPPIIQKVTFPYTRELIGLRRLKKSFIYKSLFVQGDFNVGGKAIKVTKDGFILFNEIEITTLYKELQ